MKSLQILSSLAVVMLFLGVSTASAQNTLISKTSSIDNNALVTYRKNVYQNPPAPDGYVNDYEDIFSEEENVKLDSLIRDFDKRTGIQIALISFDTSMATVDSLEALSLKMANAWGVGQKDKNNGVIVGISSGYGKVHILYGTGIDHLLTNQETNKIIQFDFVPYYENDQYYQGTVSGLTALMKLLQERYNP